jgi:hypothetical protein
MLTIPLISSEYSSIKLSCLRDSLTVRNCSEISWFHLKVELAYPNMSWNKCSSCAAWHFLDGYLGNYFWDLNMHHQVYSAPAGSVDQVRWQFFSANISNKFKLC